MQKLFRTLSMAVLATTVASCGLVYKPTMQQGNLLEKKTVDQLKPGMTKQQVIALMGSPSVTSPFDHDRWDYINTQSLHGQKPTHHELTLYFNYGVLARTEGKYYGQNAEKEQQLLNQAKKFHVESSSKGAKGDKNHDDGTEAPSGNPANPDGGD